jgi:hypothetical protein
VDEYEDHQVEHIDNSGVFWKQLQYLAKWLGYNECSWKPVINNNGLETIDNFHIEQSGTPG